MADASQTTPSEDRAATRRATFVFFVLLAVLYLPLFLGRIVFTRDIAHWIFPARWLVRQSLLAGQLPLWNPYQGLGFPVLGDPLYGVFYPPNWLVLALPGEWLANALTALGFLHMAWGGLGVLLLVRRLRVPAWPATIAALAWSLSGYVTAQWTAGLLLYAAAWIPWVALGHLALRASLRAGHARFGAGLVKAALPTGLALLMGEPFLAVMGVALGLAVVALASISERQAGRARPPRKQLALRITAHMVAVVLAVGVGAAVLVPARAVMAGSARARALPREVAEASSLHPLRLLELVAPGCMGDVYSDYPAASVVGEPRLDGLPLSYSVYLGASVLGLALMGMRRRVFPVGMAALIGVALLTALGRHLPIHALVRTLVPALAYMRYPEKYLTLVVVGVAVLAGLGAQRVLGEERQPWRRTLLLLGLLVGASGAAPFLFPYPWSGFMVLGLRHGAMAVAALLGVQALAARRSRLATPTLVAAVVLDLAISTWSLQTFVPRALAQAVPPAADRLLEEQAGRAEPPRIYRSPAVDTTLARRPVRGPAEGELRLLATLVPNTVNTWGIASLPGYDAAIPAQLDELWARGLARPPTRLATLRLLGVDDVLLSLRDDKDLAADLPGLEPVLDPLPQTRLYRVRDALPRVFLAGRGEAMTDEQAARRIFDTDVVAGHVALLPPGTPALAGPTSTPGTCTLATFAARGLRAHCRTDRSAWAVFVEQYAPGWRATVDGRPAPIARANLIMRAVQLGPGEHDIVLAYHAPGLELGLAMSLTSVALLLVGLWIGRARSS